MKKTEAFQEMGAPLISNYRWSEISSDGSFIVVQLWDFLISRAKEVGLYEDDEIIKRNIKNRNGKKRREHLEYAMAHCGGKFRLIIGTPKIVQDEPRRTKSAKPTSVEMKIIQIEPLKAKFVE